MAQKGGGGFPGVGFGGFSGAQSLADADGAPALPAEAEQALRRLAKRDATTKLKALTALRAYIADAQPEDLAALLPAWLVAHARLAGDGSRAVRAATAAAAGELAVRARKALGAHARPLIALWWPASFDAEPEVATAAASVFATAFPGGKARDALAFAAPALRDAAAQALRMRTPADLPEPAATPEEGAERLARAHAAALRSLAALPAALSPGSAAAAAALDAAAELAAEHAWLRAFVAAPDAGVRCAAFALLAATASRAPAAAAPHTLRAALAERAPGAQADALDAALALARPDGAAFWAACAADAGGDSGLVARLARLFRAAFNGATSRCAHFALPLLALLPDELAAAVLPDAADAAALPALPSLLDALWASRAAVASGDAGARAALASAYSDCAAYAVLRCGAAAAARRPDAAAAADAQTALLRFALRDRPLAALLAAPAEREAESLATTFADAVATLQPKSSLSPPARDALWVDSVAACAAAARENAAAAPAVAALLRALHARAAAAAADWAAAAFARPLARALLAGAPLADAPPGAVAALAQCVALFGPSVADADAAAAGAGAGAPGGDAGGADALVTACLREAEADGGDASGAALGGERAALLAAALTAPGGARHWPAALAALTPRTSLLTSLLARLHAHAAAATITHATALDGWQDARLDAALAEAAARLGNATDVGGATELLRVALAPPRGYGCMLSAAGAAAVASALRSHLDTRGAAAARAVPPAAALLAARLPVAQSEHAGARVALAAALFALRLDAPDAAVPGSSDDESDSENAGSDGGGEDAPMSEHAVTARAAAQAWRALCAAGTGALRVLPAAERASLAVAVTAAARTHVARSPAFRPRIEAAATARSLADALDVLCSDDGAACDAALDALVAPAGDWPAWARPAADAAPSMPFAPLPADWPRRMATLAGAAAGALRGGAAALFDGARAADAVAPPRRVWLAVELLCTGERAAVAAALTGVPSDYTPADAARRRKLGAALAHALLATSTHAAATPRACAAALAALRDALRLLCASDGAVLDASAAIDMLAAALPADGVALTPPAVAATEAAAPPLLTVLRGPRGGATRRAAAEAAALRCARAAGAALRVRGGGAATAAASLALRCAAACFPGAAADDDNAGATAEACASEAELSALCELWGAVAAADAAAAAALAAARRFGGGAEGDDDAPLAGADEGVAALALPLLRCAWPRLSRGDWTLLAGRTRRWLAAPLPALNAAAASRPAQAAPFCAAALSALPAAACALLAAAEALPVAVAEPSVSARGANAGDVVPFAARGASAAAAARAMAEAGWPTERGEAVESALAALFAAGALCRAGGGEALRGDASAEALPFWRALSALSARAPPGAARRAADAADARTGGAAIAGLYALLRCADDVDAAAHDAQHAAAALSGAAYALLAGDALRTAAVLGLDAAVADVAEVLALADKAAESGAADADADAASASPLAAAEAACLREPLAALLATPGAPRGVATLRGWALLLGALLAAQRAADTATTQRLASYVRACGRLPSLLTACADALPLPPPRALRAATSGGGGGAPSGLAALPADVAAAWRAAAEPAPALAAAASLPPACLAGALLGAAMRCCAAEARTWFADLRDASRAATLESAVAAFVSPALVAAELDAVAASTPATPVTPGGEPPPGLSVRCARGSRAITASYAVDDSALEVAIKLPPAYPLRPAEAACSRRDGVSEARLRKWLLSMASALRGGAGVAAALALWGASVEKEFAGVEACPICMMVLHAGSRALPRLACRQCPNRFHAACLYSWFNSSNKSACPICQTPWGTVL